MPRLSGPILQYIAGLEHMLGLFHNSPHMPCTPPRSTPSDLQWWKARLRQPAIACPILGSCTVSDLWAFSDAASGSGIAITIGDRWQAWQLLPGWQKSGRDITWAEAVGFELLVRAILTSPNTNSEFKVHGDNTGIVEGWWRGRSRNREVNEIFRHIHSLSESAQSLFNTFYVPSGSNPADGPSRGKHPPLDFWLPIAKIPNELKDYIAHFDTPLPPPQGITKAKWTGK
jgi:hypothetical protein